MAVRYRMPDPWIRYDRDAVIGPLVNAKAAVQALVATPFLRSWADELQAIQLKIEVAGTSRIEGAEFSERELDAALRDETPETGLTRSQRQARAAVNTYRWIARLPGDRPIDEALIRETHRRIVTGCDDDHCPPGELRAADRNVVFGMPQHRGAEGGAECGRAFGRLCEAVRRDFRAHDLLIQALALHYHIGAMHPFLDGNGRTARALEALVLQRGGLRDALFVAMSNYYHEEKPGYLRALSESAASGHDLTPFLVFGLTGIAAQCRRLSDQINLHVRKMMFRDVMYQMFNRLQSTRKRVIAKRQVGILNALLDRGPLTRVELYALVKDNYAIRNPEMAFARDVVDLVGLECLTTTNAGDSRGAQWSVRMEWPTEITETEFFKRLKTMPKVKSSAFPT